MIWLVVYLVIGFVSTVAATEIGRHEDEEVHKGVFALMVIGWLPMIAWILLDRYK